MTTHIRFALTLFLSLGALACADDESTEPVVTPAVDSAVPAPTTDSATPITPVVDTDAGPPVDKPIPLIDWVDDLVDHHTDDTSLPDTVHDKNIADNEDPSTFDRRF